VQFPEANPTARDRTRAAITWHRPMRSFRSDWRPRAGVQFGTLCLAVGRPRRRDGANLARTPTCFECAVHAHLCGVGEPLIVARSKFRCRTIDSAVLVPCFAIHFVRFRSASPSIYLANLIAEADIVAGTASICARLCALAALTRLV
jgi:hypothetical protein